MQSIIAAEVMQNGPYPWFVVKARVMRPHGIRVAMEVDKHHFIIGHIAEKRLHLLRLPEITVKAEHPAIQEPDGLTINICH